jgi:hypothetical protein
VWCTAKRDSTGYYSSPPSTPPASTSYCSSTVDLLQPPPATVHPQAPVHPASTRATPPATIQPALSTGSYPTTPPRATVHPALHRLLFILPSTGWSCSSCPPRGPVHPAPTGSVDRGSCSSRGNATGSCSSTPTAHYSSKPPATHTAHPIDRLQLAGVVQELLDRVQLTAIDRSLGFSNA